MVEQDLSGVTRVHDPHGRLIAHHLPLGPVARSFRQEDVSAIDAAALVADVFDPLAEGGLGVAGAHQFEEGLLDIDSAEHRLVCPDGLLAPGCVVPETHTDCPTVAYDDLLHRAAGADARTVGDGATGDGVSVGVHAAAGHAHSPQHE